MPAERRKCIGGNTIPREGTFERGFCGLCGTDLRIRNDGTCPNTNCATNDSWQKWLPPWRDWSGGGDSDHTLARRKAPHQAARRARRKRPNKWPDNRH